MEVTIALSNPPPSFDKVERILEQRLNTKPHRWPKPPRQHQTKLTADQRAQLLERYRKGERAYELAAEFGINRKTVAEILVRAGQRRPRSMTNEERAEAIKLYAQGWSCARIGKHLGRNHGTVWLALKAAGVKLRDEHGRTPT